MESAKISRYIKTTRHQSGELHGFSDDSEAGYAAVVYFRSCDISGEVSVTLVIAKSKVAPLKHPSLLRLKLCGAVSLSRLLSLVVNAYQSLLKIDGIFAWCDSTVVLNWIKLSPHRWKTFVANMVSYTQEHIPPSPWRYIGSDGNPDDPASRGLFPEQLRLCSVLWAGSQWLCKSKEN